MSLPDAARSPTPPAASMLRPMRRLWRALLVALASRITVGRLTVETPDGERLDFGGHAPGPAAALVIRRWRALPRIAIGGDMGFANGYVDGDWSTPDLVALIELAIRNESGLGNSTIGRLPVRLLHRLKHLSRRNTKRKSRRNIAAHYDLGNDFYASWLDASMTYSAALFRPGRETLESAQAAKNDRIAELLEMNGAKSVLEIGCGWGALVEKLAREQDCRVTGITLSTEQLAYATERVTQAGLAERTSLRLEDYRNVGGAFDRIVSIEMLEAVGEEHWPRYFGVLRERLVAGGIAVLQVITIADERFEAYRRGADFIQSYIFPGGMLPSPSALRREIERAGLELLSSETFGLDYAQTLAEWRRRFQAAWPRLHSQGLASSFKQMWEYYLAYCEAGFRTASIDVGLYRLRKAV
jgi:cyclopropane-fatty-acyl-phospholipid synthase